MNYNDFTPISEAEEKTLIMHAQAGNERAMERLMSEDGYGPLLAKKARRHMGQSKEEGDRFPYEDALQEARLAFINIVNAHDFDKAASLRTYVSVRLDHELMDVRSAYQGHFSIPTDTVQTYLKINKEAEGDIEAGAERAQKAGMSVKNYVTIQRMIDAPSLDYQTETEDGLADQHDTMTGVPVNGETDDERYTKARISLLVAQMLANSVSDEHLRIIRKAYGFDGDLDTGMGEPTLPIKSTESVAAFSDATVADSMTYEDGEKWSRPKVQRLRTAQLKAWRDDDYYRAVARELGRTKSDVSNGKDED